jgi:hypothetical protein
MSYREIWDHIHGVEAWKALQGVLAHISLLERDSLSSGSKLLE